MGQAGSQPATASQTATEGRMTFPYSRPGYIHLAVFKSNKGQRQARRNGENYTRTERKLGENIVRNWRYDLYKYELSWTR